MRTDILRASTLLASPAILRFPRVYANTLTRLIPDIYAAFDVVSRELVGFLPSVTRNTAMERAAVGEPVVYSTSPSLVAYDTIPAMVTPEPPDIAFGNNTVLINKSRGVPFGFTGEEQKGLNNGPGYLNIQASAIAQALRTICNEVETDIANSLTLAASRATGTPGVTPFATNLGDSAQVRKILDDNGATLSGRTLIANTAAGANMRTLGNLTRVNESGTQMTLRDGELLNLHGFSIKESAQALNFVAGTGSGATTNGAAYAVGATLITLASAGTGTIKNGDVVTLAGDTNKYVVAAGNSNVSAGGTITLASPGLRVAVPAAATAITVVASHACNVAFSSDAFVIAMRPPAKPVEGDNRADEMLITDPRSGITFEMTVWTGYRKTRFEVALAWGMKAVKSDNIALLLG